MTDYGKMTQEEFDSILAEIVETTPGIIQIPGVYEILAEHFNNEVLDRWEQSQGFCDGCGEILPCLTEDCHKEGGEG